MADGNVIYGKSLSINNAGTNNAVPLGSISATGNIFGNVISANVYANFFTGGNIGVGGTITSNGQIRGANVISNGVVSSANISTGPVNATGAITTSSAVVAVSNITGGNLLTAGQVSATGNVSGNYFIGNGSFLTGLTSQLSGTMVGNISANGFYINGLTAVSVTNLTTTGNVQAGTFRNTDGTLATTGPAFIATQTSYQTIPYSPTTINGLGMIYNNVTKNIGSGYNPSTGVFIAPVAGFYQVNASTTINPFANTSYYGAGAMLLYRNSATIASGPFILAQALIVGGVTLAVVSQSSASTLVYLNVGDTLRAVLGYVTNAPNIWTTGQGNAIVQNSFQACWLRS